MRTIGVLALQGSFAEHVAMLRQLGVDAPEVRLPHQLDNLDGLVIPGGESTTIGKLLVTYGLREPLRAAARAGLPIYGTCAGLILLARDVGGLDQPLIGQMDITVQRNGYGRQLESFEADVIAGPLGETPFRGIFIRAPKIIGLGPTVETVARLDGGAPVAARQANLLVSAFHPELTGDPRFHRYFLGEVAGIAC